jgi:hypothetical protein
MIDTNLRRASEAWCPLVRPVNRLDYDQNGLVINAANCCIGSRCAMWSTSHDKDGEEIGGVCGAALTGQILSDA